MRGLPAAIYLYLYVPDLRSHYLIEFTGRLEPHVAT